MSIVIYGVGSRMVREVAETCTRLNLKIVAWVRNIAGPVFIPDDAAVTEADDISTEMMKIRFMVPQFLPGARQSALEEARTRGFKGAATLVDPTAVVASSTKIAEGSYINSMANIGAAAVVGRFNFINRGASVGHDVDLADFVSVGPGAVVAGGVSIGRGALVGAAAVVLPNLAIGQDVVIGAGAVVTKDVPPHSVVIGNPARVLQRRF